MSKQTIGEKISRIRNEKNKHGNTKERVASVLTDINNSKADLYKYSTYLDFPTNIQLDSLYLDQSKGDLYVGWSDPNYFGDPGLPGGTYYKNLSLKLGETSSTAYRGDRGKIAYDHSQVTHDKTLVGLGNVDNTSDLDKPISTATQNALVDGLATKLNKGSYTGNAQDLKNDIETKQKKLSSFDESILIETDGNIEGNVSLFTEYFQQQVCELNFVPTQILGVYQDGLKLLPEEFNITLPKKITIKTYSTEKIEIQYTHLKNN